MERNEIDSLIERFASQHDAQFSDVELKELYKVFSQNESDEDFNDWLLNKWNTVADNGNQLTYSDLSDKRKEHGINNHRITKVLRITRNIAAALLIPVAATVFFMYQSGDIRLSEIGAEGSSGDVSLAQNATNSGMSQEYYSPAGTRSKIILHDSTVVWLNGDSRLLVSGDYGSTARKVTLSGNAYFDVTPNKESPFYVSVRDMTIKVTGTTFSVDGYTPEKGVETVLISGSIEIDNAGATTLVKPSQRVVLTPGERGVMIDSVRTESYRMWKDGVLVFNDTQMSDVVETLEHWFNVNINVDSRSIMNYRFTGRLDNCSIAQVMEYISYSSPIEYQIDKHNVKITKK